MKENKTGGKKSILIRFVRFSGVCEQIDTLKLLPVLPGIATAVQIFMRGEIEKLKVFGTVADWNFVGLS